MQVFCAGTWRTKICSVSTPSSLTRVSRGWKEEKEEVGKQSPMEKRRRNGRTSIVLIFFFDRVKPWTIQSIQSLHPNLKLLAHFMTERMAGFLPSFSTLSISVLQLLQQGQGQGFFGSVCAEIGGTFHPNSPLSVMMDERKQELGQ